MAGYIAGRPCVFGGNKYLIGDLIPFEAVDPKREKALIGSGHIYRNPDYIPNTGFETMELSVAELKVNITISKSDDGSKTAVFLTPGEIHDVFQAWIENVDVAKSIVTTATNPSVLETIKVKETRKGVLDAIDKKIAELPSLTDCEEAEQDVDASEDNAEPAAIADVGEPDTEESVAEEGEEVGEA